MFREFKFLFLISFVSLAASLSDAQAGTADDAKFKHCVFVAAAYQYVGSTRDHGMSPEQSLDSTIAAFGPGTSGNLPDNQLKEIINQMYFDPGFAGAGGEPLRVQVLDVCMGVNQWKPLK